MSVKWPLAYSGVVLFTSADGPWHTVEWFSLPLPMAPGIQWSGSLYLCRWHTVEWFSLPLPINATSGHLHHFDVLQVSSNKTDCPNLTEILLKMLLHTNNNRW